MEGIVIIGNGISGVTAARHIRKRSDLPITIISSESKYFYSRTALMYIYMGHMREEDTQPYEPYFWKKNRIALIHDHVEEIDVDSKQLKLKKSPALNYSKLVLAVGSKPNKFGWKGQDLKGVSGLYSLQDLETIESFSSSTRHAVIVGGGLIGVELAEMFHSRGIHVTFLVREKRFWGNVLPREEGDLIMREIRKNGIELKLNAELDEVIGDESGRVKAVKTKEGEVIECQFVGLTAGVSPNIDIVKNTAIASNRGILVNAHFETNVEDVYAIGDCAEFQVPVPGRKAIEQVWYTGRIMGETLAANLTGKRIAYNPGPWFNSAKFFDVEYQTYGWVNANPSDHEADYYWEDKTGTRAMHFVWDKESHVFLGINTFGIRLRHEIFDQWLHDKVGIEEVLANLKTANFDPELYKSFEAEIINGFNQKTGLNISGNNKIWWQKLLNS